MRRLVLLTLLAGCSGSGLDPSQDADGDGFSMNDGDCDDANTGIFPGASERCDGVDSDCDGADGGSDLVGGSTFYEDSDEDGYGAEDTAVSACESPGDAWAEQPGDCAPDDAAIHPGADEVCDGVDNNCSGAPDDGLRDVFADADGDGFGDPSAPVEGCETGPNRAANSDDCDDDDAAVTPNTIWYFDTDEDGFGIDEVTELSCTSPGGDYARQGGDCRPDDPNGFPGSDEICSDGLQPQNIDDNCNGEVDEGCDAIVTCETISTDTTWSGSVLVPCDIVVEGSPTPTLTIEDGAIVRFGPGGSLTVGRLNDGRLVVQGEEQGVTLTSTSFVGEAGDWSGVDLDRAPGSVLTGLTMEFAGSDRPALILGADDTQVDGLTIRNSAGVGLRVEGAGPTITDLTITDVAGTAVECVVGGDVSIVNATVGSVGSPMITHLDCADAFSGELAFSDMQDEYVTVTSSAMSESATWLNLGVPYRLERGASVARADGVVVWTLEPGVVVEVANGQRVRIGALGGGQLIAVGTENQPVVFTSAAESPAPGDWTGLVITHQTATSILHHVEILYTGSSTVFDAGLYISGDGAAVAADELFVAFGAADGITVWNGTLELSNSEVLQMAGDGLVVDAFGDLTSVDDSTFSENGGAARFANSDAITRLGAGMSFVDNTDDRIRITDMTLKRDSVWRDLGVPYLIETSLTVASLEGTALSLTNTQLQFGDGAQLQIGFAGGQTGSLTATNTEFVGEPSASPGAGFWNGIAVRGPVSIVGSTVRHAGGAPSSAVDLFSGSSSISLTTFEDIEGTAITCWPSSGPNTVDSNTFTRVGQSTDGCD